MKQSKRILAYSALALVVMLAAFGAIAFDTSNVAYAQGPVPAAPTLTAEASGATTIDLSWNDVDDAARYELWAWDSVDEWRQLGGATLTGTSYSHPDLTSGTTYYYQIRAVNSDGAAGGWSDRVNEVAGDMGPDEPVLTATAGYQQIRVSWPAVTGATRYELWAWDGNWERLDGGSADPLIANSYVHTGLTTGRTYYYQGRAVDSAGVMSAWSAQVSATVLSAPNISAPTSFNAARGDEQVTLTWSAPSRLAGLTIAKYQYRYVEDGGTFADSWTDVVGALTATQSGLTNGTEYDFEIQAVSTTGALGDTASDSATPSTVPGAPTLSAVGYYRYIVLEWTAPADNGGAAISTYRIERENDDGTWSRRTTVPAGTVTWRDNSGLSDGKEYTYRIFAINVAGDSDWTSASAIALANPAQEPAAPIGVQGVAGAGMVTLSWDPPAFNGGAQILGYEYQYKETTDGSYGSWKDVGLETEDVEVPSLTPMTGYTFAVRARNSVGRGAAAESANVIPDATVPTAEPRLSIERAADTSDGDDQFRLEWNALGNTEDGDGDDTTNVINNYDLQWKSTPGYVNADGTLDTSDWPDDEATDSHAQVLEDGDAPSGKYSVLHDDILSGTPLIPGATFYYRVRAVSPAGDGDWSNEVSMTTPPNLAGQPTAQLAVPAGTGAIKVSWTAPDSGGTTITSYELQVRTGVPDEADPSIADFEMDTTTTITNLPGDREEYTHKGIRAGVAYYYRVRAVNVAGNGMWSAITAEAEPSPAVPGTPGPPTISSGPTVAANATSYTLVWAAPDDRGTLPITGYEVQYQRDDDGDVDEWNDATVVEFNTPTTTSHEHKNIEGGSVYEYRVRAVNGHGPGQWQTAAHRVTAEVRAPSAPVLTATATGTDEIRLEWTIPESNGTTIDGYELLQWNGNTFGTDDLLDEASESADTTLFTVSDLTAGTEYFFVVRAESAQGLEGLWSTGEAALVNGADPDDGATSETTMMSVPSQPMLTVPDSGVNLPPTTDTITVTWTAPTNGGSDITSYEVRKWDSATQKWVHEANVAAEADEDEDTNYTSADEDLEAYTLYYYILRASNGAGAGPWSEPVSGRTAAGAPDAPVLTAHTATSSSIRLSWTTPDANGSTITGYELERWNDDDSAWGDVNGFVETNTLTEYTDPGPTDGLAAGTKYFYRIRATATQLPSGDAPSAWSGQAILRMIQQQARRLHSLPVLVQMHRS